MTTFRVLPAAMRAVLFDLDGTLVVTHNRWGELLGERLVPLERLLPFVDARALGRWLVLSAEMPMNYAVAGAERLGLTTMLAGLGDRVRRSKGLATREGAMLIPGTQELLRALHPRHRLGVVTTRARREALAFLSACGLTEYIAAVVTRQDVWLMKPHPQPVRRAARLLGVRPEECLMLGDTVMDVRAACSAGAYAVGVLTGFANRAELQRAGAALVLERAADLRDYLPAPTGERNA